MANVPSLVSLKEVSSSCWLLPYLLCQYQQVMVVADGDSAQLALQILWAPIYKQFEEGTVNNSYLSLFLFQKHL